MLSKTYSELIKLPTFDERFEYLKLGGAVGEDTFAHHRYLNQALYRSEEWKRCRRQIIIRDNGCDLACEGFEIPVRILIHHINPITIDDVLHRRSIVFDPENLITTSHQTHNAIHYGNIDLLATSPVVRQKNDTCPWRRN